MGAAQIVFDLAKTLEFALLNLVLRNITDCKRTNPYVGPGPVCDIELLF